MKYLIVILSCLWIAGDLPARAQDSAPYIYYYSQDSQSFIVERADSSDAHTFGLNVLSQPSTYITGPGWSPDGHWFAFNIPPYDLNDAFVIPVDPSEKQTIEAIYFGEEMHWSPDSHYLLVSGSISGAVECVGFCHYQSNWLVDVKNNQKLAWFDVTRGDEGSGANPIEWDIPHAQVKIYRKEAELGSINVSGFYRITLYFDGRVEKQPIPESLYRSLRQNMPSSVDAFDYLSPSGRYDIARNGQLTDTQTQSSIKRPSLNDDTASETEISSTTQLPMPIFTVGDQVFNADTIDAVRWDPTETWALLSYFTIPKGGADTGSIAAAIVRSDGTGFRQLTLCGEAPACFGWLPANVDVSKLPPLTKK